MGTGGEAVASKSESVATSNARRPRARACAGAKARARPPLGTAVDPGAHEGTCQAGENGRPRWREEGPASTTATAKQQPRSDRAESRRARILRCGHTARPPAHRTRRFTRSFALAASVRTLLSRSLSTASHPRDRGGVRRPFGGTAPPCPDAHFCPTLRASQVRCGRHDLVCE